MLRAILKSKVTLTLLLVAGTLLLVSSCQRRGCPGDFGQAKVETTDVDERV